MACGSYFPVHAAARATAALAAHLPLQLSTLAHLASLHLVAVRSHSEDYDWLPRMRALTDLRMSECDALPDTLDELTWLRRLEVRNGPTCSTPALPLQRPIMLHGAHRLNCSNS